MARVLVTGIGGFTGRYVAHALTARGHHVFGMKHDINEPHVSEASEIHVADLSDIWGLRNLLIQTKPEWIVHLAAISSVAHSNINAIYGANLLGTINLLTAAGDADLKLQNILLASSANIYGNSHPGRLDENTPPLPANHYGVSKWAMECAAKLFSPRLPITIVRPFNYTGVGQTTNFIIPKLVDHARRGQAQIELGNLDVARDISDVRTVADCYARLLERPEAVGQTVNVCSGHAYALNDVIAMLENLSELKFEISVNPDFVREGEIKNLFGDQGKLKSIIGDVKMPPLEDTLRWMLRA